MQCVDVCRPAERGASRRIRTRPDHGTLRRLRQGCHHDEGLGLSALVEINGKRILFDTGDNPEIFAANVKAKGVDLTRLDFVVMSHRHGDHMGGLTHLLRVNPHVKIYAPKENFGVYGFALPSRDGDGTHAMDETDQNLRKVMLPIAGEVTAQ